MKLIFFILSLLPAFLTAQYRPGRIAHNLGMSFVSGMSDGIGDNLQFKYDQTIFVNNPKFWNPEISWKNKYKDWPTDKRAKFPMSTTSLVFLTDGWHLSRTISRTSFRISTITYKQPEKDIKIWHKIADFSLMFLSYSIGWHTANKLTIK